MLLTMKANEVLNLLRISRKTLHVYASTGKIKFRVMPNGYYDYNDEDVYKLLNREMDEDGTRYFISGGNMTSFLTLKSISMFSI